jgi:hypothetical protein
MSVPFSLDYVSGSFIVGILYIAILSYRRKDISPESATVDFFQGVLLILGINSVILGFVEDFTNFSNSTEIRQTLTIGGLVLGIVSLKYFKDNFVEKVIEESVITGQTKSQPKVDIDIREFRFDYIEFKPKKKLGLYLEYNVLNKGEKQVTIHDVKYNYLEPINQKLNIPIIFNKVREKHYSLSKKPLMIFPQTTKVIKDYIPYPRQLPKAEGLSSITLEFILFHALGEVKLQKELKLNLI